MTEAAAGTSRWADLDRLVEDLLRGERDGDVEAILSTMTDDVEHELLGLAGNPASTRGKDALRNRYLQLSANTVREREVPLRRLYGDGFVVDEMVWEGYVTGRLGPLIGNGRRVSNRLLRVLEVRNGRISRLTLYSDVAAIMRQLS